MKFPFFNRKKKQPKYKEGVVSNMRASTFFLSAPEKEKGQLLDKVLKEVNQEQKEIVEEFGEAAV
jgi:hypothetical protein